jgi:hypothetical protein
VPGQSVLAEKQDKEFFHFREYYIVFRLWSKKARIIMKSYLTALPVNQRCCICQLW